ncbi:hypothetical protein [Streptomyces niger]|uniref:hypothetical protein n=1 Tax=Streptomyces niger TaxID=66373 RepID=UPI00069CB2D8|nr:hypothetical protein [Streptomyces niger]
MPAPKSYLGPDSFFDWRADNKQGSVDVVLLTHPRDEADASRLFPFIDKLDRPEIARLQRHLQPMFGEIVSTGDFTVGIMFLPFYAHELIDPESRRRCAQILQEDAVRMAAKAGARILCLGGLTGALSLYGRRLVEPAKQAGLTLTTGHALTAVGVHQTYWQALEQLERAPGDQRLTVLGVGSIGRAFMELLQASGQPPRELVLVDRPQAAGKLERLAQVFHEQTGAQTSFEVTDALGALAPDSACYATDVLVSAVSTPYVVDIDKVAPGTILIDDSQPFCWDREKAWQRCVEAADIVPCDAGLVDCAGIGYRSAFPFDFADAGADGSSTTAWTCQTEGMLLALDEDLPRTVGEPTIDTILAYQDAYHRQGLRIPTLQCGPNPLPIDKIKAAAASVAA